MNQDQFSSYLAVTVPAIIEKIVEHSNVSDREAILRFYHSKLYAELSDETSKLWHYGPMTLYTMFNDELLTGAYAYPEGASI